MPLGSINYPSSFVRRNYPSINSAFSTTPHCIDLIHFSCYYMLERVYSKAVCVYINQYFLTPITTAYALSVCHAEKLPPIENHKPSDSRPWLVKLGLISCH